MTACKYGAYCVFRNPKLANDNLPTLCKRSRDLLAANDNKPKVAQFYLMSEELLVKPENRMRLAKFLRERCRLYGLSRRETASWLAGKLHLGDFEVIFLESGDYFCVCSIDVDKLFETGEFHYLSHIIEHADALPQQRLQGNMILHWRVIELALLRDGLDLAEQAEVPPEMMR